MLEKRESIVSVTSSFSGFLDVVVVALYCHYSQVPAKLAINLSIHTQHTYDKGVDRTGRQGIEENTAFT